VLLVELLVPTVPFVGVTPDELVPELFVAVMFDAEELVKFEV